MIRHISAKIHTKLAPRFDYVALYGSFARFRPSRKKVLYIFLGNVAIKAYYVDIAEAAYQEALAINPDYSRAYAGLASVCRAAVVVLAREANGWIEWSYEDGKTINEVQ